MRMLWTEGTVAATGRTGAWTGAAGTTGTTGRGSMKGAIAGDIAGAAFKEAVVGVRVVVVMIDRRVGPCDGAAAGKGVAAAGDVFAHPEASDGCATGRMLATATG